MFHSRVSIIIVLTLALLATGCGVQLDVPVKTPGPEIVEGIAVPLPGGAETPRLKLTFGAGDLLLSAGGSQLVSGTATYNVPDLKPEVAASGSQVSIQLGQYTLDGLPSVSGMVNRWDLQLGVAPMELEIEAGAYHAEFNLGGLSLTGLTIQDGASDVELAFAEPNLVEMSFLRYETGASNVTMNGLANANFSSMTFECGAGNYSLDFSGQLARDANISIEAGLGNLTLVIPEGVSAVINVESGLSNITFPGGWAQTGNVYTQAGSGPTLTFVIEIGAGNLTVRH